ncbi:MAG: hypothetical protein CVV49_09890 [Spirochaetae bacterium HGW-Spirochaetae-5]|nr:MAG: hypothetical protein CVV49_09890 [Spirochaetae bacterium HGW-Spirochaetae-5]
MKKNLSKLLIIVMAIISISVFSNSCYDDNGDAVVTIHLERNDLAAMGVQYREGIIDKILNFFSTRAEAGGWQPTKTLVTLTVSSGCFNEQVFTISPTTTTFTTTLPSGCETTFTVTSSYDDIFMTYTFQKNWGGQTNLILTPGEQDIRIQILPMAFISGWNTVSHQVGWAEPSGSSAYTIVSYNIYRSTSIHGKYNYIGSSTNTPYIDSAIGGTTRYYYKLSTLSKLNDNILRESMTNDPKTWP